MDSLNSLEGVAECKFKLNEDGSLYQTMPKVKGKSFRCDCGCNVFHQPVDDNSIYICNCCETEYKGT